MTGGGEEGLSHHGVYSINIVVLGAKYGTLPYVGCIVQFPATLQHVAPINERDEIRQPALLEKTLRDEIRQPAL